LGFRPSLNRLLAGNKNSLAAIRCEAGIVRGVKTQAPNIFYVLNKKRYLKSISCCHHYNY